MDVRWRRREREDPFLHLTPIHKKARVIPVGRDVQQDGHAGAQHLDELRAPAAGVADDGEVLHGLAGHGGDEIAGALARPAEAADEQHGAVSEVRHRLIEAAYNLIDRHRSPPHATGRK